MGLTQNLGRLSPSIFSDASLNIGVGAAPSGTYKFEVTGLSGFSSYLTVSSGSYLTSRLKLNNTATGGNLWSISSGDANNSTNNSLFAIINETLSKNTFVLSPTGKLAIGADLGTTNPADALAIFDTNTILKVVDLTGNNSSVTLQATNTAAYVNAGYVFGGTAIPLIFQTGNTTRLTLAATGAATFTGALNGTSAVFSSSVGVGGTSAGNFSGVGFTGPFLDIAGILQIKGTSANTLAAFQLGGDTYRKALIYTPVGTDTPYLAFGVATSGSSSFANEVMRITSAGNVGIGTTSPDNLLVVSGGTGSARIEAISSNRSALAITNTGNGLYMGIDNSSGTYFGSSAYAINFQGSGNYPMLFWTNSTERMRITSGGNVGIGTSSPGVSLEVNGNIRSVPTYNNTSANIPNMYISAGGTFERGTASSKRFKENILKWDGKGLETILALKPTTFTYKETYYKNHLFVS